MPIIPIQEIYTEKIKRIKDIKELEIHGSGCCVHLGKISPGCYKCIIPESFYFNIPTSGGICNADCTYCTSFKVYKLDEEFKNNLRKKIFHKAHQPVSFKPRIPSVSFTGGGEPLLDIEFVEEMMSFIKDVVKEAKINPWYHLYTNGIAVDSDKMLRLKDSGIDEIRFHLGASNFSKNVYKNIEIATKYLDVVTVETPAWPPQREKLFEMLSIINDLGVMHLNIGEIELNECNKDRVLSALPDARLYLCHVWHLFDEGLVFDLIEEVVKNKYNYSFLVCDSFLKLIQRGRAKWLMHEDCDDIFARYKKLEDV